jgi:hypothetical protein
MKEKPREKTKEEEAELEVVEPEVQSEVKEVEEQAEAETHSPEVEVEPEVVKPTEVIEEVVPQSVETAMTEGVIEEILMPSWGGTDQSEWMYGIPTREDDEELWAGEWADFLLQWMEYNTVHVLSLAHSSQSHHSRIYGTRLTVLRG